MAFRALVFILTAGLAVSYKTGPPISDNADLCQTLFPSGHEAEATIAEDFFTIATSQSCFKAGQTVKLTITSSGDKIEGFFIQARTGEFKDATQSYGKFCSAIKYTSPVDCFNGKENAIAHKGDEPKVKSLIVYWTAPSSGLVADVKIGGTLLLHKAEFYVNEYKTLTYDANCQQVSVDDCIQYGKDKSSSSHLTSTSVILLSIFTLLYSLL